MSYVWRFPLVRCELQTYAFPMRDLDVDLQAELSMRITVRIRILLSG